MSLLLEFSLDGFTDVFLHHVLLHLAADDVLNLTRTCKRAAAHRKEFITFFAEKCPGLECASCKSIIPLSRAANKRRNIVWVQRGEWLLPLHHVDTRQVDVDSIYYQSWCSSEEPIFETASVFFHNIEPREQETTRFAELLENTSSNVCPVAFVDWDCIDCETSVRDFELSSRLIYPVLSPL